jgi:hypothetical protein
VPPGDQWPPSRVVSQHKSARGSAKSAERSTSGFISIIPVVVALMYRTLGRTSKTQGPDRMDMMMRALH